MPGKQESMIEPLEAAVDHVRGSKTGRLIVEYGDYECPYSRQAFRAIERVEARLRDSVRFALVVLERVRRDVRSGDASGEVRGTPTLFIDGVVHRGGYDVPSLMDVLAS
jgi:protein-disulfide isomerase